MRIYTHYCVAFRERKRERQRQRETERQRQRQRETDRELGPDWGGRASAPSVGPSFYGWLLGGLKIR